MPVNGSKAPTCPVSRDQALPGMPANQMPAIPRALDLPSAIAALNQMALLLNPRVGYGQSTSTTVTDKDSAPRGNPKQDDGGGNKGKTPHWREFDRQIDKYEIVNPDDRSIVIVYPQIVRLYFIEEASQIDLRWWIL